MIIRFKQRVYALGLCDQTWQVDIDCIAVPRIGESVVLSAVNGGQAVKVMDVVHEPGQRRVEVRLLGRGNIPIETMPSVEAAFLSFGWERVQ